MAKAKHTKSKAKHTHPAVRLRPLLTAMQARRLHATRKLRMTQADYAVALDRVIRAIGRSHPGRTIVVRAVRVW